MHRSAQKMGWRRALALLAPLFGCESVEIAFCTGVGNRAKTLFRFCFCCLLGYLRGGKWRRRRIRKKLFQHDSVLRQCKQRSYFRCKKLAVFFKWFTFKGVRLRAFPWLREVFCAVRSKNQPKCRTPFAT